MRTDVVIHSLESFRAQRGLHAFHMVHDDLKAIDIQCLQPIFDVTRLFLVCSPQTGFEDQRPRSVFE